MMIFFFFKPLEIKKREFVDVPLFKISKFSMYELDSVGLQTIMLGEEALRYEDRYTVKSIDFTDNSQEFISNVKADNGLYKDEVLNLKGNIAYYRADGLAFETPTLMYNTKTSIAHTDDAYVAYVGENTMHGVSLEYNSLINKIESKNVVMTYQLQER